MSYIKALKENCFPNCLEEVHTVAILGHIRPDGDCVGSCLGLCTFLLDQDPGLLVDVYLDPIPDQLTFLKHADRIRQVNQDSVIYDLCVALDCSEPGRLSHSPETFYGAGRRICIDHHITNEGYGDISIVYPQSSSASELLYYLLKETCLFGNGRISLDCARSLYTGIVFDTGVFRHSNTTLETMTAAGELIGYGLNTEKIITDTMDKKTYRQNQLLGKALLDSIMMLEGRMIFSALYRKDFEIYGCDSKDTEGIIDQLRVTDGVHVAMFLYEAKEGEFKVSLRSDEYVDVAKIAREFGGGGHVRAAGCSICGQVHDIVMNIAARVENQLLEAQEAND